MKQKQISSVKMQGHRIHFRVPKRDSCGYRIYPRLSVDIRMLYSVLPCSQGSCRLWCHGKKNDFTRLAVGNESAFIRLLNQYRQEKYKDTLAIIKDDVLYIYVSQWVSGNEVPVARNINMFDILLAKQCDDYTTHIVLHSGESLVVHGYIQEVYDGFVKTCSSDEDTDT